MEFDITGTEIRSWLDDQQGTEKMQDLNPYSSANASAHGIQRTAWWPSKSLACGIATIASMVVIMICFSSYINATYHPNMRTWVIPYYLFTIVSGVPLSLVSALTAPRWKGYLMTSPFISGTSAIALLFAPIPLIPLLKDQEISFLLQSCILEAYTVCPSLLFGLTVHSVMSRIEQGKYP